MACIIKQTRTFTASDPDNYREGYNHTNLRGLEKVNGEMALIMTIYNMKRALNILGTQALIEKLKKWKPKYPTLHKSDQKQSILVRSAIFPILNYKYVA
jgi:hypothetical protein